MKLSDLYHTQVHEGRIVVQVLRSMPEYPFWRWWYIVQSSVYSIFILTSQIEYAHHFISVDEANAWIKIACEAGGEVESKVK